MAEQKPGQDWTEYGSLEGQVISEMGRNGKRRIISVFKDGAWQKNPKPKLRERIAQLFKRG